MARVARVARMACASPRASRRAGARARRPDSLSCASPRRLAAPRARAPSRARRSPQTCRRWASRRTRSGPTPCPTRWSASPSLGSDGWAAASDLAGTVRPSDVHVD
eukprot:2158166-Prymnesium_polylepis.1